MQDAGEKYREFISLLENWGVRQEDFDKAIRGEKSLTRDAKIYWGQAAFAFNKGSYNLLKDKAKNTEGFKIILLDSIIGNNLSVVKKALLYTDLIVIYSGAPTYSDLSDGLVDGLRRGGSHM